MKDLLGDYKLVLGLEIHTQPKTDRKMFCGCSAKIWRAKPNTHTCPTCLGLPGALPVPNFEAIEKTQLLGLAMNCTLNKNSRFDRKHYFYPDLPKGFQISQYKQPLCVDGFLHLDSGAVADIERIHLEEDTAKSFHKNGKTLVDFNKSGMPLIELVTRPCFRTIEDAVDFSKKFQNILRYTGISDADMEKGQFRIEPNISLRTAQMEMNDILFNYKVEIKNINSFKFMEKAARAEIIRQREILESGDTPAQENRGYDEATGETVPQRSKEEAHDYRYFPEPDIPPMEFEETHFANLRGQLPELPHQIIDRLHQEHGVKLRTAKVLVENLGEDYVRKFDALVKKGLDGAKVANLMVNKKDYQDLPITKFAKKMQEEETVADLDLGPLVEEVLAENAKAVQDYKNGKESAVQFLLGMVMRKSRGKADAKEVEKLLVQEIKKRT